MLRLPDPIDLNDSNGQPEDKPSPEPPGPQVGGPAQFRRVAKTASRSNRHGLSAIVAALDEFEGPDAEFEATPDAPDAPATGSSATDSTSSEGSPEASSQASAGQGHSYHGECYACPIGSTMVSLRRKHPEAYDQATAISKSLAAIVGNLFELLEASMQYSNPAAAKKEPAKVQRFRVD